MLGCVLRQTGNKHFPGWNPSVDLTRRGFGPETCPPQLPPYFFRENIENGSFLVLSGHATWHIAAWFFTRKKLGTVDYLKMSFPSEIKYTCSKICTLPT